MTRIKSGQDMAAGLLFAAIGVAGLWIGRDYPMGTSARLGTGAFPAILCWSLLAIGAAVAGKALIVEGPKLTAWAWRPVLMVVAAIVAFALLIDRAGLIVAMVGSMTLAALGTHETRWREFAMFTAIMLLTGIALFIWALNMPIKVLPWN